MSNSPIARTSTTGSSSNSPSQREIAVVACGALATHVADIATRRGWPVHVHPLPPLLHNRPARIAHAVDAAIDTLAPRFPVIAVAFADCGTYGALDKVCTRRGVPRLRGEHCYEVFAGTRYAELLATEPGTYVLTDFLVRSFRRTVVAELGLDHHPELRDDYFRHYRRVVWLAQHPTPHLHAQAITAAATIGLPLEIEEVGNTGLEQELAAIVNNNNRNPETD